jgi:hypothetical protein
MLINSLEKMEEIVKTNKTLAWIGWDVVENTFDPGARFKVEGVRINNKWYTQKRFALSTDGWEIPNKFVR